MIFRKMLPVLKLLMIFGNDGKRKGDRKNRQSKGRDKIHPISL